MANATGRTDEQQGEKDDGDQQQGSKLLMNVGVVIAIEDEQLAVAARPPGLHAIGEAWPA